jgi:putative sterol carrier protein
MNARELFLRRLPKQLRERVELHGRAQEVCKFRITGPGGGTWVVDFSESVPAVREADEDAHCVITLSSDDLSEVAAGALDPRALFLAGRLKVAGYLDLAIKMGKMLQPLAC